MYEGPATLEGGEDIASDNRGDILLRGSHAIPERVEGEEAGGDESGGWLEVVFLEGGEGGCVHGNKCDRIILLFYDE